MAKATVKELTVGDPAPPFTLPSVGGSVSLSQFRGKWVVLYFYPKDDTPGCTREACAFRDGYQRYKAANAVVLGVSCDAVASHEKFGDKFDLPFPLLADEKKEVATAYGVYKEKSLYGKTYLGIERTTFLIDPKGKIANIFPRVKVDGHDREVLEVIRALGKGA